MPCFVMYTATVVYQAPQMKNCRNIMMESLSRVDIAEGIGGESVNRTR